MKTFWQRKIGFKVGAWFLLITVVPLTGITVLTQKNIREAVVVEMTAHLRDLLHEKIERIELYVEEQRQTLRTLALAPTIVRAADRLSSSAVATRMKDGGAAVGISAEAEMFLSKYLQQVGYHDIFLIAPGGDIVYTVAREDDLGTNLYTGPYSDSGLAQVFDKAITLLDTEISSFAYYPPSRKPAAFIATPIFGERGLLGVLAAQVNEDRLFYIFTDYLGLGESGELVGGRLRADGSIVAAGPLRHKPEALNNELVLAGDTTLPIQLAVTGQHGTGITLDYRGRAIIAAWGYVPSMDWGLVVKIDRDEAFAPIYRQTWILAGVALVTLGLVLFGIFFATGDITRPIKHLALVMQHFANGDFKARAEKRREDEVGLLAEHFNDMADTIEQYTFTMEQEVATRTAELARAKHSLDRAQGIAHIGSWGWDIVTGKLVWSDEIYRIFGLAPQQFGATYDAFMEAIHPDDRELVTGAVKKSLVGDIPYAVNHRVVRPDGSIRIVEERGEIRRDEHGQPLSMLGTVQDVTELRAVQKRLSEYVEIIDENVLTSVTDINGNITYVSDAFCRTSGYDRDELLGRNHRVIRHPEMPKELYEKLWKTIRGGAIWKGVFRNTTKSGGSYWVESTISPTFDDAGNIAGFTAIHNDITDKKRIEKISITDALTGLFNRRRFNEMFPQELNRARRDGKIFALIMLDVDNFKNYNDTYGHQKGDEVLHRVGAEIKKTLKRSGDVAFRLGGEEFGVTITVREEKDALGIAERIRLAIENLRIPHEKNSPNRFVTISCGVKAVETERKQTNDVDVIYRMADAALYQAKGAGRNRVMIFKE